MTPNTTDGIRDLVSLAVRTHRRNPLPSPTHFSLMLDWYLAAVDGLAAADQLPVVPIGRGQRIDDVTAGLQLRGTPPRPLGCRAGVIASHHWEAASVA